MCIYNPGKLTDFKCKQWLRWSRHVMDNLIERLKIVEKRCRLLIHRHSVDNLRIHHQKCKQHFPFVRQPAITGRAAPREQTPLGCVCVLPKDTRLCLQHSMVIIYSSISCGIPIATANTTLGHSLPWVRERVWERDKRERERECVWVVFFLVPPVLLSSSRRRRKPWPFRCSCLPGGSKHPLEQIQQGMVVLFSRIWEKSV